MFLRCLKPLCTGRAKFTLPTPASSPPVPASSGFTPVFVLHPYTRIRSCFRFSPIPSRFFRLYSCFRPLPLYRIRSCFRFSPNPAPLLSALLLLPSFILIPAFALISDFPPILSRFFRLYSCFCPSLYPHSLLFPIFPQSCPAFSGFTPVFALYPYTRIRSCFRFFPNPVPLLPALLLFLPFTLIPAFALVSDFFSILPRFFRFYSCFRPSLYPHSLLLTSSRHIHFFYVLNVCISRQMQTCRPGRKACAASGRAFEFRNG